MFRRTPPKPFLSRIFQPSVKPEISEGWIYSAEEAAVYGGYADHHAVDFSVPFATPVLAAADGLALASFEEVRIRYPGNTPRTRNGEPIFWGYGLFVVVLHDNGLITCYCHLHRISPVLWNEAYLEPTRYPTGDVIPALMSLGVRDFKKTHTAVRVHRGETIGLSGITGMGVGRPTYMDWLQKRLYRSNDEEHVHFAVCTPPVLDASTTYIDSFGIQGYGSVYPSWEADWSTLPNSLWLR